MEYGNMIYFKFLWQNRGAPVNSVGNWNDNLSAIFEAKLMFECQSRSLPIAFLSTVGTI